MARRLLLLALLLAVTITATLALPKFASRLKMSCQSCHVNPAGGGMRKAFGVTYGQEDLPVAAWQEGSGFEGFSTKLNEAIAFGADFRTLYLYQKSDGADRSAFIQMQTDLYVSAQLAKSATLYVSKGQGNRFEAFGLATVLPLHGYIKAGWFAPAYGLRMDDHTMFIRSKTLFASSAGQDAGLEIAVTPGPITFTGAVSNGSANTVEDNQAKALLGRAEASFAIASLNVRLGTNYYNSATASGVTTLFGGFATLSLAENLTLLGEFNRRRSFLNTTAASTAGNILSLELDYMLFQGLDLKLGYDFYDEDIDLQTGTEARYVVGAEFFPMPGIELRPMIVIQKEKPTDLTNDQALVLLHIYL